jgi:alpha/beta superfamily hydrolase
VTIPGPAGSLEALLDLPTAAAGETVRPRAAVVFAHPHPQHGGTMHTKTVYQSSKALARTGCAVLRFNFRGVGTSAGAFSGGPGEQEDFTAAITYLADQYPGVPLWAAGFSFGAWVALETGAADDRVTTLIGIAPPVAREGYVFDGVSTSIKPKFFVQGERDEVCLLLDLRLFYGKLPEPKEMVVIDAANHLFDGRTSEVGDALEDLLGDFSA